jgi:cell division septum initiation protein DivIVA
LGRLPRITKRPHPSVDEEWESVWETLITTFRDEVTRARAAERAELDDGWAVLHEAVERGRLLDERAAARHETAMKEAEEIRVSVADEAKEVLARARTTAREILAQAHAEAMEITATARQRIPLPLGHPTQP